MLSENLRQMYDWFEEERLNPGAMGERGALQFSRCLAACAAQAEALERSRVADPARLTAEDLDDPKIELFPVVARPTPKDGGAA